MAARIDDGGDALSPEGMERLLRLLATQPRRLSFAEIDGRTVWIKRFDTERRPLAKRLHALASPLLPSALHASPNVDAAGAAMREARKAASFNAAGFPTPAILWRGGAVLVLAEVSEIVQKMLGRLREADPAGHEDLLVEMAAALGRVHAVGLCHGRPHPRDMFRRADGTWGYLDFEEEPEAAMPLATAQARDVWVLFMQIVARAQHEDTGARAFAAWRAGARRHSRRGACRRWRRSTTAGRARRRRVWATSPCRSCGTGWCGSTPRDPTGCVTARRPTQQDQRYASTYIFGAVFPRARARA